MTSTLASQSKLADLTNKFDGKTPDNSSKVFLAEKDTTVKDMILQCLHKCGIAEPNIILPYFSLYESKNGSNIDQSLNMEITIIEVINNWTDLNISQTAKFLFMIRLHMPCLWGFQHKDIVAYRLNKPKTMLTLEQYFNEAEIVDVNILHIQFIQAIYNVITSRYPTSLEQAIELGSILFLFKFHDYQPTIHKVGFLGNRIVEFIPVKHLRNHSMDSIEEQLFHKIQDIVNTTTTNTTTATTTSSSDNTINSTSQMKYFQRNNKIITPQCKYMELIYNMDNIYGVTFYRVHQHCTRILPEVMNLGIFYLGINIYDKNKKLIRFFHIEDIYRWGFKPNLMFYFEISEENDLGTASLEFDTVDGKVISDLLTDYAMGFLKEREREDERFDHMKAGHFDIEQTHSRVLRLGGGSNTDEYISTGRDREYATTGASTRAGSSSGVPPPPPPPGGRSGAPPLPGTKAPHRAPAVRTRLSTEDTAAVVIQAMVRGVLLRTSWMREDAAILMQSIYRGYRARVLLSNMIEELIKQGEM